MAASPSKTCKFDQGTDDNLTQVTTSLRLGKSGCGRGPYRLSALSSGAKLRKGCHAGGGKEEKALMSSYPRSSWGL